MTILTGVWVAGLCAVWASPPAAGPASPAAATEAEQSQILASLSQSLEKKDFAGGLAEAAKAAPRMSEQALPKLFLLVGRLYEGQKDLPRAGVAYMRVVVHFSAADEAPDAMLAVARIHEQINRKDVAKRVYETLRDRYPNSAPGQQARKVLLAWPE